MSIWRKVLIIIFALIFVGCGIRLAVVLDGYRKADLIYEGSREAFQAGQASEPPVENEVEQPESEPFPDVTIDFDQLLSVNPDIAGWIWIPDTEISYPIMKGIDNYEYLQTSYDYQSTSSGSIFMDYRCSKDFSDINTLIFGHNMRNGSMFGSLKSFEEQAFFEAHRELYIYTPEADYRFKIFSAYKTEDGSKSYDISFKDKDELGEYIKLICENSTIESGIVPTKTDKMIMLSTCSGNVWNARFVLHGVLSDTQTH